MKSWPLAYPVFVALGYLERRLYEPMAGLPELKGAGNEG